VQRRGVPRTSRTLESGVIMASGSGVRERMTRDEVDELLRHWERTLLPIKPDDPVRMTFMVTISDVAVSKKIADF
jgi:hypothetical protein